MLKYGIAHGQPQRADPQGLVLFFMDQDWIKYGTKICKKRSNLTRCYSVNRLECGAKYPYNTKYPNQEKIKMYTVAEADQFKQLREQRDD